MNIAFIRYKRRNRSISNLNAVVIVRDFTTLTQRLGMFYLEHPKITHFLKADQATAKAADIFRWVTKFDGFTPAGWL